MAAANTWRLYTADSQKTSAAPAYEFCSAKDLNLKEGWFQEVIKANPSLVIEPCRRGGLTDEEWYFWAKEFMAIDILLVSNSGRIGIVETKLSFNPGKRRSVIAQVLDYAVSLSELDPDKLPPLPKIDGHEVASHDDVQVHLADGDHLLIIAGDELDPRATKLSRAMLGENLTLPWDLALVEISPCQRIVGQDGPALILVPSLRSTLRQEVRQVVRVEVKDASDAKVAIERVPPGDGKNRIFTEDEFLKNVEAMGKPGSRSRQRAKSLISFGRSVSDGGDPFRSPSKKGSAIFDLGEVGLFTLYPIEGIYVRVLRNLGHKGAPKADRDWDEVIARLNACKLAKFTRDDLNHAKMVDKPLSAMTDEEEARFREFIKWFAEGVAKRAATREQGRGMLPV